MIIISLLFRKAFVSPFLIDRHMGIAANTGVIRTLGSDDAIAFGCCNRRKTDAIARAGRRRSYFLAILCIALAGILIYRLHWLQIVNGERYLSDFETSIRRTVVTRGKRGKIYDAKGKVLAETVSSYNITMNDLTEDSSTDQSVLNNTIKEVIEIVDENGGKMYNDFNIVLNGGSYYFKEMGSTAKKRFLADVYGYADPADLSEEELNKSPEDVISDLADRYGISTSENDDRKVVLDMVIARYNLSLNYYQKYISTVLAKNVPEKTKKAIETRFNSSTDGVQIEEELVRRYTDGIIYFSNIIGYTGEADESYLEEEEHAGTDEQGHPLYHEGDMIGLTGIEASQEAVLHAVPVCPVSAELRGCCRLPWGSESVFFGLVFRFRLSFTQPLSRRRTRRSSRPPRVSGSAPCTDIVPSAASR